MPDWPTFGFVAAYFGLSGLALYLQYRSHQHILAEMSVAHEKHTADLRMVIEVLRATLELARRDLGDHEVAEDSPRRKRQGIQPL